MPRTDTLTARAEKQSVQSFHLISNVGLLENVFHYHFTIFCYPLPLLLILAHFQSAMLLNYYYLFINI